MGIQQGSLSEEVISVLVQVGIATRQMMSTVMYYTVVGKDGQEAVEQYRCNSLPLTKAIGRILEKGYITSIKDGEKEYYCLTPLGWHYARTHNLLVDNSVSESDICNTRSYNAVLAHSYAFYVARSMRVFAFPVEKPEFGDFCNKLDAFNLFRTNNEGRASAFPKEDIINMLSTGICYSKKEMRSAYNHSSSSALETNSSRRLGMIFTADRIITLYFMESKNTVLSLRAEQEFDTVITEDVSNYYSHLSSIPMTAYILVPSMTYLPTFFHGYPDGIEPKRKAGISVTDSEKSKFKMEKLTHYREIYMMPMQPSSAEYREALFNYTRRDYEADEAHFRQTHPEVGRCVICRYPNLTQLRKIYSAKDTVTLVGPNDPVMVDMLSRCMRNRLRGFYDIDTGKPIPYRRYNSYGYPLIGNTEQIDHDAQWKVNVKIKAKKTE